MMQINVKLYGSLRELAPESRNGRFATEIADSATVADLKTQLKLTRATVAAVNGDHIEDDHILKNNDQVSIFAVMSGG